MTAFIFSLHRFSNALSEPSSLQHRN